MPPSLIRLFAAELHDGDVMLTGATRLLGADSASSGWKWRVQIIEAGLDKNNVDYPISVLTAAAPLYESARVFALTEGQHTASKHPFGKSVRDIVGFLSGVRPNETGLEGTLTIIKSAQWLRDMLVSAWEAGKTDLVGLSHDVLGKATVQGNKRVVSQIVKVDSVDVVYEPAAGGQFLRMAAAAQAGQKEATMFKQLLAALRKQRPDLEAQISALEAKGDAVTADEVSQLVAAVAQPQAGQKDDVKEHITKLMASLTDVTTRQANELVASATKKFEDTQKLLACSSVLAEELNASQLPDILKAGLQKQFSGRIFEAEELKAAIIDNKKIADTLTASGTPQGGGGLRVHVAEGEPEKLQAAFDKLMGCDVDERFKDIPAFTSLRSAYRRITGDGGDGGITGHPSREGMKLGEAFMNLMRLPAAYASNSFSFVQGNSMYRRLIKEYLAVKYFEETLISFYRNVQDFRTQEIIQVGYFGDIGNVDPETADYPEVTMPTDIEATYTLNQKGVILTVTRKTILNDDLKSLSQLISKLGRAARRTHAKRAWTKVISNATYKGDNTALFHANHANLGATTLTLDATGIATLTARLKAMYAQAEQDSSEVLGLVPMYLWVPRELREIAEGLNAPWPGAATPNPHAGRFGQNHERILTNPLMTDSNDWGMIADGNDVELLEAAYMNGRREPEFFVADNPSVGQMFVADKIQYKMRHEYEFEIADYRGFDKAVVA